MDHVIPDEMKFDTNVNKGFTKSEIIANAMLVIIAGHETTASVLQFLLFELAKVSIMSHIL